MRRQAISLTMPGFSLHAFLVFAGILVICNLFVCPASSSAASKAKTPKNKKTVVVPYEDQPFDRTLEKLKPNFLGHSYLSIYKVLRQNMPEFYLKNEFETQEQYNNRIVEFGHTIFDGKSRLDSLLSFVIYDTPHTKYDADKQTMYVNINTIPLEDHNSNIMHSENIHGVTIDSKPATHSYYTGTNAFGTKLKIKHTSSTSIDLAFENYIQSQRFNIDINKAKDAKKNGTLMIIGYLNPPYYDLVKKDWPATIDQPFSSSELILCLTFKAKEVWFINKKSGEIYDKLVLQPERIQ